MTGAARSSVSGRERVAARSARVEARLRLGAKGALAAALLLPPTTGCFAYAAASPAGGPVPGRAVELTINDAGRVGLAPLLGPGVLRVAGTLAAAADSDYVVNVATVDAIGSGTATWGGDTVRVRRNYVDSLTERRFSRGRTAIAVAAVTALIASIATRSLNGIGGNGGGGTKLPPDTGGT